MRVISGMPNELSGELFSKISSYRHKVFIEMLGWELQTKQGIELDQYDRPGTVYVVSQDDDGTVNGCARLLPTDRPYLLGEVFPQLLNGQTPPSSPDIWELSRSAAVDFSNQMSSAMGQFSSEIAVELLRRSIACAAEQGAKGLITVSSLVGLISRPTCSIPVNRCRRVGICKYWFRLWVLHKKANKKRIGK